MEGLGPGPLYHAIVGVIIDYLHLCLRELVIESPFPRGGVGRESFTHPGATGRREGTR